MRLGLLVSNAPLTPEGRRRLCERIDAGRPISHIAAETGVSRRCLSKWYGRWQRVRRIVTAAHEGRTHGPPR